MFLMYTCIIIIYLVVLDIDNKTWITFINPLDRHGKLL